MSRPNTKTPDLLIDPRLQTPTDGHTTDEQFNNYLALPVDAPTLSSLSASNNVLHEVEFITAEGPNSTTSLTPDLSNFTFEQGNIASFLKSAQDPDQSPGQLQREWSLQSSQDPPSYPRPTPLMNAHQPNCQSHGHDLVAQGDIVCTATSSQPRPTTPTFYRLQPLRTRPHPHDQQQSQRYTRHGLSCQHSRARTLQERYMRTLPIGQPLATVNELDNIQRPTPAFCTSYFVRMGREDQARHSARVIEVGAMAVMDAQVSCDTWLEAVRASAVKGNEYVRRDGETGRVDELLVHFEHGVGKCAEGVKGCEMIRQALGQRQERGGDDGVLREEENLNGSTAEKGLKTIAEDASLCGQSDWLYAGEVDDDELFREFVNDDESL